MAFYTDPGLPAADLWERLCRTELPRLWMPKREDLRFVDAIPSLGTGKVDLRAVRQLAPPAPEAVADMERSCSSGVQVVLVVGPPRRSIVMFFRTRSVARGRRGVERATGAAVGTARLRPCRPGVPTARDLSPAGRVPRTYSGSPSHSGDRRAAATRRRGPAHRTSRRMPEPRARIAREPHRRTLAALHRHRPRSSIGVAYFEKLAIDNNWIGRDRARDPGRRARPHAHLRRHRVSSAPATRPTAR